MGKLVKARTWGREKFETGSRPSKEKIASWISRGEIPGCVIDGEPYVDADGAEIALDMAARQQAEGEDEGPVPAGRVLALVRAGLQIN